jgi:hypothetical protein
LARQTGRRGVAVVAGMTSHPLRAQGVGKYLAPQDQVIVIRAGQLFDSRSGSIRNNQVVLITGDRITDVGAAVKFPTGTRVLDLSSATVLPRHNRHPCPCEHRRGYACSTISALARGRAHVRAAGASPYDWPFASLPWVSVTLRLA